MTCHCPTDAAIRDALTALVASVRAAERERIAREIEEHVASARRAYRAANVDHLAHDYCRWVGHAEAGLIAAAIARTEPAP